LIEIPCSAEFLPELIVHAHKRLATFVDELKSSVHCRDLAEVFVRMVSFSAVVLQEVRHLKGVFWREIMHPLALIFFKPRDGDVERGHSGNIAF